MDLQWWHRQRRSFGAAADLYDRVRPGYPVEAVRWMLAPAGTGRLRVVDLGAGTGILTRLLVGLGHDVLPVEPDPQMRARLAEATPGVHPQAGSAEEIPVADGSVDAVLAGQAYHWFDRDRAHPEIARALRPGGVFGAVWNDRDEEVAWLAELTRIAETLDQHRGDAPSRARTSAVGALGAGFGPTVSSTFRHATRHTPASLVDLVRTRSYYLVATPERRAEVDAAIQALAAGHPDLAGRAEFEVPYVTTAFRAVRLAG